MPKIIVMFAAVLTLALAAAAEEVPQMEAFLGYNYVRFNPNSGLFSSFNASGGGGQIAYNANNWLSGVVDIGAVTNGSIGALGIDSTVLNFVAGPRFSYRRYSRFTPFAQVLFGGAYSTASVQVGVATLPPGITLFPGSGITARLHASNTGFAMFAGGGLDIRLGEHVAVRPIGADYYLTRLPSLLTGDTTNRNNFRYSAGINFLFGAQ
jgi:Outer membrane protein beta-barrel domain